MFENEKCIKIMFIGYFLIAIIIFYSFSKINSIEKMSDTTSVHDVVKQIYDLDMTPINRLSNFIKELENGTADDIEGNVIIKGSLKNFPVGSIIAWNKQEIPSGWVLCDGTNDTPDLRGRMILGSGPKTINTKGGEETHVLTQDEIPSHNHNTSYTYMNQISKSNVGVNVYNCMSCGGRSGLTSVSWDKDSSNPQPKNKGNSEPHNNMPPYYVLNWIMKL